MIHEYTENIMRELNCDVWVETGLGSYGGGSREKVRSWFPEIIQYEVDISQTNIDKLTTDNKPKNLIIEQGNSPEFLKKHINDISNYNLPIFFLDAHNDSDTTDYWPLREELKVILDLPKCVIVIDDFKHPFKKFNYDSYTVTVDEDPIPNDLDNIRDLLKKAKIQSVYHCKETSWEPDLLGNMGVVFIFKGIVYNNDNFFDEERVN